MAVFTKQELVEPNLVQKMFGRQPKENAEVEINNLLANHESTLHEVTSLNIFEIAAKYKINIDKNNETFRIVLFRKYLTHCLKDKHLDEQEISSLKHLQQILLIDEKVTKSLLENEAQKIYGEKLHEIVESGTMNDQEKSTLERIKANLQLPDDIAQNIYKNITGDYLKKFFKGAIEDERLSPDEERELNKIADRLNIKPDIDEKTNKLLDTYRLYWQIENGELPQIESDINLKSGELLHFMCYVKWNEYRRVPKRVNYGGPTGRIKIAKGLYYRYGSIGYQNVSSEEMQTVDSGYCYLTNKRLIFTGSRGNKTIPLSKILSYKPYKNGIDVQKDSGKSPFLEFEKNTIVGAMILGRLLNEI